MARNPYGNGHRGPDWRSRESSAESAWPGDYGDDLDEGRFSTHPMQRAGRGFSQSAPQPRGSRYGSQESDYGSGPHGSREWREGSRYGGGQESGYASQPWRGSRYESQAGSRPSYGGQGSPQRFPTARGQEMQGSQQDTQRSRSRGPRNWQRSDERIREDVCERLASLDDVDVSDVSVSVQQGKVTLTGTVAERADKHRVEDMADDCIGVRDVDNQIRVRRGDQRSSGFWSQLFGFDAGARARDVMTREVITVSPSDTVQRAAQIMRDASIGSVPVCDGQRLQGMVTDRDIAVRVVAAGMPADRTQASQAMTAEVFWCYEDDDVADVLDKMGDRQVRRIPVVDHDHKLTGIISLGDMAVHRSGDQVQDALEEISTPSSKESTSGSATSTASTVSSSGSQQRH